MSVKWRLTTEKNAIRISSSTRGKSNYFNIEESNKTRKILKKRRRLNFNEFIDGLDPNLNSNNFWKVIKLFRNSEFFSPVRSKGNAVDGFIDNFAPAGNMDPFPKVVSSRHPSFFNMQFQLH